MIILSIETSCDETALSILKVGGSKQAPQFRILGNNVASQIALHTKYGGVFPMMAKREHGKNIVPLFLKTLKEAKLLRKSKSSLYTKTRLQKIERLLEREHELGTLFLKELPTIQIPKIDAIAVTSGPGLEPTLWVGINFAKALSTLWDIPVIPVNHMEGHILSVFPEKNKKTFAVKKIKFPALSLLVSGGHTELVLITDWGKYKIIGATRDDAAGEAFDKVARMLDLPYPGGPQISKYAKAHRTHSTDNPFTFPRPMINSKDFDFSFSGLKTSVLYTIQKLTLTDTIKGAIAAAFEDATIDVLVHKTLRAIEKYKIQTLIVGGGVAANILFRKKLEKIAREKKKTLYFPTKELSTDNSLMIGIAGFMGWQKKKHGVRQSSLKAQGNLSL